MQTAAENREPAPLVSTAESQLYQVAEACSQWLNSLVSAKCLNANLVNTWNEDIVLVAIRYNFNSNQAVLARSQGLSAGS